MEPEIKLSDTHRICAQDRKVERGAAVLEEGRGVRVDNRGWWKRWTKYCVLCLVCVIQI